LASSAVLLADLDAVDGPGESRLIGVRRIATVDEHAPRGIEPALDVVVHVLASMIYARLLDVHDLNPQQAVRVRVADVVVAVRQRYCNPASTAAEREIPSSAAWTMRKMKTAAAAANAIRNRGK
jgi:hypothetical protein